MSSPRSIFLCYRRDDTEDVAGRLQGDLRKKLSKPGRQASVFMDQTSMPAGTRWPDTIKKEIGRSEVMVVLIGPKWLARAPDTNRSRLFEENDEVRFEIAMAIELKKPIVPVLINGAAKPTRSELPSGLTGLTAFQYGNLATRNYVTDFKTLHQDLKRVAGSSGSDVPQRRTTPSTFVKLAVALVAAVAAVGLLLIRPQSSPPPDPGPATTTSALPEPPTKTVPPSVTPLPTFPPEPDVRLVGSPTFDAMIKAGRIRIATKTDQPGLTYRDADGNWAGFDSGIANLIAAKLGFSPQHVDRVSAETDTLSSLVSEHDVHLAISAYTITTFRLKTISFAGPYFQAGQSILVRRDEQHIVSKETFNGKIVCSVTGSTALHKITTPSLGQSKTLDMASAANCVDALLAGDVDAVTTDDAILAGFQQRHPDALKIVGGQFSVEPWGVGLAKGDTVLCKKINSILTEAVRDGTWAKIFDATLGGSGIQARPPTASDATCI